MKSWLLIAAPIAMALTGCGGDGDDAPVTLAPTPAPTPTPTAVAALAANTACVAGTWSVAAPDPNDSVNRDMPVRHETAHFAFRWYDQVSNEADARAAGEFMEMAWGQFIDKIDMLQPFCTSAAKRKVNVFVGQGYGLSGGIDATGTPGMWIGPGGCATGTAWRTNSPMRCKAAPVACRIHPMSAGCGRIMPIG